MWYDTYEEAFKAWKRLYEKDPSTYRWAVIEMDDTGHFYIQIVFEYKEEE